MLAADTPKNPPDVAVDDPNRPVVGAELVDDPNRPGELLAADLPNRDPPDVAVDEADLPNNPVAAPAEDDAETLRSLSEAVATLPVSAVEETFVSSVVEDTLEASAVAWAKLNDGVVLDTCQND